PTRTGPGTQSTTCHSRPCQTEITKPFFPPESIGSRSFGRRRRGSPIIQDTGRAGQEGAACSRRQLRQRDIDVVPASFLHQRESVSLLAKRYLSHHKKGILPHKRNTLRAAAAHKQPVVK